MHPRHSCNKGFLVIAAIGVTAVLMIVVMGVAALVGQTNKSLAVYKDRSAARDAVEMYLPGVVADYRSKGATSLALDFESPGMKCSFTVNPAAPDDALLQRLGVRAGAGDLMITAQAAPQNGPASRFTILAAPSASGPRPYIILSAAQAAGGE